jgi:catechol 2,3-dioxygenase-like lactoylglutathione lyase family enzyme
MTTTDVNSATAITPPAPGTVDFKLEVVVLPVTDVDRAKQFYASLGWREDADFPIRDDFRVVQMTPPGSPTSIIFGSGVVAGAAPAQSLVLAVYDIDVARADMIARGADVSEVFHGGSAYDQKLTRVSGPDPEGKSYSSFASFSDPDGNGWLLQEIKTRLPGR